MKLSIKALIFSGIVFPGAGYFVLNRTKQGMAFLILTLSGLVVVMYDAFQKAQIISEKIAYGYLPIDIAVIRQAIEELPDIVDSSILSALYMGIFGLWLVGLIDSYRIGKSQDKNDAT